MHRSNPSGLLTALLGTSAAVGVLDLDLRLTWASQPYLDFFGSESKPIGRRLYDLAKREENLPFYEALEATANDGIRRTVRNDSGDFGITFDNVISRSTAWWWSRPPM